MAGSVVDRRSPFLRGYKNFVSIFQAKARWLWMR